ncbi:ShlB/FhaC/HecB family hemolysin secretion/activation protein [Conchiformibius steedae]
MRLNDHCHLPIAWDSSLHAQWNKTPLTPQDKIAIGNGIV